MARGEVRTSFALQATALASHFNDLFAKVKIPGGFVATLTAPDGPSTGGGKQSLQHITLMGGGVSVVMGHLDTREMKAVLRTYAHVKKQRRGQPLALDEKSYLAFYERVKQWSDGLHFEHEVEDVPDFQSSVTEPAMMLKRPVSAAVAKPPSSKFWLGFMVGGLLFGGAVALAMWLTFRPH